MAAVVNILVVSMRLGYAQHRSLCITSPAVLNTVRVRGRVSSRSYGGRSACTDLYYTDRRRRAARAGRAPRPARSKTYRRLCQIARPTPIHPIRTTTSTTEIPRSRTGPASAPRRAAAYRVPYAVSGGRIDRFRVPATSGMASDSDCRGIVRGSRTGESRPAGDLSAVVTLGREVYIGLASVL